LTVELSPALKLHVLPPPHVDVQFDPQVPLHVDCPSHVVLQPVPQSVVHVFFEPQSYVALFGGAVPPSASTPPSPLALPPPPIVQCPPDLHVQVDAVH
jgi:hypothetical protein